MERLAQKECIPCQGGVPALEGEDLNRLWLELGRDWKLTEGHHLSKSFKFTDFKGALEFTIKVGELAEKVWHHPDIMLSWGNVEIKIYTHKIDGLVESDFILAAKIEDEIIGKVRSVLH